MQPEYLARLSAPVQEFIREVEGARIASLKMLPDSVVDSPEMLPGSRATMMPPTPGRHYEDEDDTRGACRVGRRRSE